MKYILFTHNDLDGAGCDVVFRTFFAGKDIAISHSSIEEVNNRVRRTLANATVGPDNTTIFFADIGPDEELLKEIVGAGYHCYQFDHHPTASSIPGLADGSHLDLTGYGSGTSLIFSFLDKNYDRFGLSPVRSKRFAEFVETVRSWDTWDWVRNGNKKAKFMSTLFFMIGYDRFVNFHVERWTNEKDRDRFPLLLPEHMFFIEARLESAQEVIDAMTPSQVITRQVFGYRSAIVFSGSGFTFSEGSYQFLRKYPEYDLMVNVNLARRTVSYRTIRTDIDLGKLAQTIGGGGHAKSAGSSVTVDKLGRIIDQLIE